MDQPHFSAGKICSLEKHSNRQFDSPPPAELLRMGARLCFTMLVLVQDSPPPTFLNLSLEFRSTSQRLNLISEQIYSHYSFLERRREGGCNEGTKNLPSEKCNLACGVRRKESRKRLAPKTAFWAEKPHPKVKSGTSGTLLRKPWKLCWVAKWPF